MPFSGQRYCSPDLDESNAQSFGSGGSNEPLRQLPFDHVLGSSFSDRPSVLYADILSHSFRQFHETLSQTAKGGQTSYRVRYKPSTAVERSPLTVSGYGVQLALKRTDYIVIDDRDADSKDKDSEEDKTEDEDSAGDATLSEQEVSDLRPLSSSELRRLGVKAASFVIDSETPFDTLLRLTQDFPKHSSSIAAMNVSKDFVTEHDANREILLPPGFNVLWINGVQIMHRDLDAFALLEHLRRERRMINSVQEIGLTGPQAIDFLSHEAIAFSQVDLEAQRYDWRDDNEGGNVVIWMNDIEKDKRYEDLPDDLMALLQRTYPGQLPAVRKDIHNLVIPVDFSDYTDVELIVETVLGFVKRQLPIRFGLVPLTRSKNAVNQAMTMYYLVERYGLAAGIDYLTRSLEGNGRKHGAPQEQYFSKAIDDRELRRDQTALSLGDIAKERKLESRVKAAQAYISRLGPSSEQPPILANGVPIAKSEEWLQHMSQRVSTDSRQVQQAVYEGTITDDSYIPEMWLSTASMRRNPVIIPEDEKQIRHINLNDFPEIANLPSLPASKDTVEQELIHLTIAADLDSEEGFVNLMETLLFQRAHDNIELALLHVPSDPHTKKRIASVYDTVFGPESMSQLQLRFDIMVARDDSNSFRDDSSLPTLTFDQRKAIYSKMYFEWAAEFTAETDDTVNQNWAPYRRLISFLDIKPGQQALLVNGRIVGPMDSSVELEQNDLEILLQYERKMRLLPAAKTIQSLGLNDKASSPLAFARISNLIAMSLISDVPEGIFEASPTVRLSVFKNWTSEHTAIHVGDPETATIQIYAAVDPTSEVAQRWIPIIKVLSELDGVHTCLFLNPKKKLQEIPIKRFYRNVLSSKPTFESDGSLRSLSAQFSGLPAEALLNIGMDLPPSWLIAPEQSIHDLDNIKLSAINNDADVEAIYKIENILIEGHSRDVNIGSPPRGVQLVLGTDHEAHFADTIIMANLGYFQFKANPGIYSLELQRGRSEEIFKIDSAGTMGYKAQPGDNGTEIALMSFRGATLFPRLSRIPGMEEEDVLEASKTALESLAGNADKLLAQAGFAAPETSKYISKAAKFGSSLFGSRKEVDISARRHTEINIFSVASGHLYERMLNIMMVSVMKHTNHTVKFWFIEQFLSPSFKDFLPVMAQEYGFQYEMVTYKWPHWLRGQTEKQREIWGYKILFLDVLFPLDLDKVIFVDADQIVRTDMYELVQHDLEGAPYGFTPMCDSRTEMEGFRFWKQGYWKNFLRGLPYHISALYVVDLKKFRQIAAGDRLRQNYHQLSADPNSLSNLDQDLPNHMQSLLPIHSLPQEWLWCETWCSDESLKDAKTIDLCNNPQTKEPKLDRARRQVPEWTVYDDEIAQVAKRYKDRQAGGETLNHDGQPGTDRGGPSASEEESIQERLQREDAERERDEKKKEHVRDEL